MENKVLFEIPYLSEISKEIKEIKSMLQGKLNDNDKLDRKSICRKYNICMATLASWQKDGLIYQKVGRRVFICPKDVDEYMKTKDLLKY